MDEAAPASAPAPAVAVASVAAQPKALYTRRNAGGGDCFWLAVASLLRDYQGSAREALAAACSRVGLDVNALSPRQMRACVYRLFLRPFPDTDAILARWIEMVSDSTLRHEVLHARCLAGKTVDGLTEQDREDLMIACLDPIQCWGDEAAVLLLEQLLGIRCLVLVQGRLQVRRHTGLGADHKPVVYVVLSLCGVHYEAVSWFDAAGREYTAFAEEELPDVLIRLSHRDCRVAEEPFISMQHLTLRVPLSDEKALAERGTADQRARPRVAVALTCASPAMLAHFDTCTAHLAHIRAENAAFNSRVLSSATGHRSAWQQAKDRHGVGSDGGTGAGPAFQQQHESYEHVFGGLIIPPVIQSKVTRLQCGLSLVRGGDCDDNGSADCNEYSGDDDDDWPASSSDPAWVRPCVRRLPFARSSQGVACPPLW